MFRISKKPSAFAKPIKEPSEEVVPVVLLIKCIYGLSNLYKLKVSLGAVVPIPTLPPLK